MDAANICQYVYAMNGQPGTAVNSNTKQKPGASTEEQNNRLFFRLFQTANIYHTQAVRILDISAVQGAVLGALSREPTTGMTFSGLYTYLAVSRQNLDAVLKGLERSGYVERIEAEGDRRTRIVVLTPDGITAWNELYQKTIAFYAQGIRDIPQAELIACSETLAKIGRALKSANGIEPASKSLPLKRKPRSRQ
jgi:DNA-binding MarR family transcriptional regulator